MAATETVAVRRGRVRRARGVLFFAFAFAVMADPVSSVAYAIEAALRALGGHLELLVPTMGISNAALAIYFIGIAATAEPGVLHAMLTLRTLLLVAVVAPLCALVSLQFAVVVSSRVNDPRTAQQFGVLIILPLTALLVAQFTGSMWLTVRWRQGSRGWLRGRFVALRCWRITTDGQRHSGWLIGERQGRGQAGQGRAQEQEGPSQGPDQVTPGASRNPAATASVILRS